MSNHVHPTDEFQFLPFLLFPQKNQNDSSFNSGDSPNHRILQFDCRIYLSSMGSAQKIRTPWELKVSDLKLKKKF